MSRGRERRSEGRPFQTEGPTIEKAPFLSGGSASMWHHKVPLGGRPERSATRAGRSMPYYQLPKVWSPQLFISFIMLLKPNHLYYHLYYITLYLGDLWAEPLWFLCGCPLDTC